LELGGELDALGLAAGELGGGLAETKVAEADVAQGSEAAGRRGDVVEEVGRLVDGHPQDVGDVAVAISDGERLGVVAGAAAQWHRSFRRQASERLRPGPSRSPSS
jgi:hypothetical protein